MSRRTPKALASVSGAVALLALPSAAGAKPPVGECPASFTNESVLKTPESFWDQALKIDANDDGRVCFKPMGHTGSTNVIDNIGHNR